jgi:hypothetical protein
MGTTGYSVIIKDTLVKNVGIIYNVARIHFLLLILVSYPEGGSPLI